MSSLILESALRALALAIAAWTVLRLLRVRDVMAQKCAWTVVLAASLVMPALLLVSTQWPAWPAATLRIPTISQRRATIPDRLVAAPTASAAAQPHAPKALSTEVAPARVALTGRYPAPVVSTDHASAPKQPPADLTLDFSSFILPIYLAITGLFLIRLMNGLASVLNLWRSAEPVSHAVSRVAQNLPVRTSPAISSPISTWRGVVLPVDHTTWDEKKLRIVLAHERSHIRQGDFYLQLLAGLYQALVWFSPLGWWLKRNLSDLGEAISDRAGIAEAASRFSYAQVLLEFAVAPRTPLIGVAMARPSSLSVRMERLLNESNFRQAFAGGRRVLIAALLAPIVLLAASALVRVEAAPVQITSPTPAQVQPDAQPTPQAQAQPAPQPDARIISDGLGSSGSADAHIISDGVGESGSANARVTSIGIGASGSADAAAQATTITNSSDGHRYSYSNDYYAYSSSDNGDAYALVLNNDDKISFSGDWNDAQREEIERARKSAGAGSFIWFRHDGKSYIITDQAAVQRVADMYKPIQALGKEQEELGRQQEALGKQQEELGHSQENVNVDSPQFKEEMAKLKEKLSELQGQIDKEVTESTINNLQERLGELQSRIGEIQGEIASKQGMIGAQQGKFGAEQGKLGAEQGRLGEQQGKLAREVDEKVKSLIDQSLKDGKAQPEK